MKLKFYCSNAKTRPMLYAIGLAMIAVPPLLSISPVSPIGGLSLVSSAAAAEPMLDLNRASADQLAALPGIGSVRARAIIARRSEMPFDRVEELLDVPGIGNAVFAGIRERIRIVVPRAAPSE